ncbi:MAG: Tat pathway signal protein [Candidatus Dactylopiibacterium carminicum]|nr:MAG: Tat pathway signal protein [Candidatus Dactylopiibacterium carminicum]
MSQTSRREFLRQAAAFSLLQAAGPLGLQLAGIGAASAAEAPADDYRVLVCLFLYGANDGHNTVLPLAPDAYATYAAARASIALPHEQILPLPGQDLGLHPALAPLHPLFQRGQMAVLANVGPLLVPIPDATAFKAGVIPRPPKLFSHNDQQAIWQAFSPEGATLGWGGRIADLLASHNGSPLFTAVSASGSAVLLAGKQTLPYQITPEGAIGFQRITTGKPRTAAVTQALRAQISAGSGLIARDYAAVVERSIEAESLLSGALAGLPAEDARVALPEDLARNNLAKQLQIVARLIGVRGESGLAQRRQVFFVSLGGFDTHDDQLVRQQKLLTDVASAVAWFQEALGRLEASRQVTLFTASDFGRTLTANGDGSDHGWGSHHFIVGGAVQGGKVYGEFPEVALSTRLDVGNGRLLPTTAVDQYAATLARWIGVREADLPLVLPNVRQFGSHDLGFMRT